MGSAPSISAQITLNFVLLGQRLAHQSPHVPDSCEAPLEQQQTSWPHVGGTASSLRPRGFTPSVGYVWRIKACMPLRLSLTGLTHRPDDPPLYTHPQFTMFSTLAFTFLASAGALAIPACGLALPSSNITTRTTVVDPVLLPITPEVRYWTTAPYFPSTSPLSDATFRPHNEITALSHDYVTAPDGKLSMKAYYPEGSYTFTTSPQGGFSFYAPGPASVDLTTAKEATFGYSVYFPSGFQFVKGGKLPGLCESPSACLTSPGS